MTTRTAKTDPLVPSRADFRFLKKLLASSYGSKIEHRPDEYEIISKVFVRAGGSWERVFLGSFRDVSLLKKVIRVAYDKGHLTRLPEWK